MAPPLARRNSCVNASYEVAGLRVAQSMLCAAFRFVLKQKVAPRGYAASQRSGGA